MSLSKSMMGALRRGLCLLSGGGDTGRKGMYTREGLLFQNMGRMNGVGFLVWSLGIQYRVQGVIFWLIGWERALCLLFQDCLGWRLTKIH